MKLQLLTMALATASLAVGLSSESLADGSDDPLSAEISREVEKGRENFWTSEEGLESSEESREGMNDEEKSETTEEIREYIIDHLKGESGNDTVIIVPIPV